MGPLPAGGRPLFAGAGRPGPPAARPGEAASPARAAPRRFADGWTKSSASSTMPAADAPGPAGAASLGAGGRINRRVCGEEPVQDVDVLVVDDELKILEMYGKRLGWRGIPVRLAGGADEALAAVEEREPDVVILDVRMPGRDGLEVLAELRRRHPRVQVIMLTGHASVESARKGMELGAFDYLIKPVALEDLLAKVGEAAKAARA